ncbi:DUF2860 domain-containing protein [Vibrio japonicus]|uniref:DUF2860 domain-containing protein n=1 Tax=Vibrio japonicus TaxID=1824638 RepID=A0ABY5LF56_9VIBR|nr:DUF2860 domain-containing protein [Vibrio japonicus]UUM30644.1 DUF2860 domain-containing protein [Vibrio japonicus]
MKAQLTLLSLAIASTPTMAKLSEHSGFSGEVSLSAGYVSSKSNFDTEGEKTVDQFNQEASTDSRITALPLGKLNYTFGHSLDKQVYIGTSREDIAIGALAVELGYKQQLGSGTIVDVSVLPSIMSGETWADPFVVNQTRQKTDEDGMAYRLKFTNIQGSHFSLDTAFGSKDIDEERSGVTQLTADQAKLLDRDSDWYYMRGSYRMPLGNSTYLVPALTYISADADGDANSYDSYRGEVSYATLLDRHKLAITAGYTHRSYDEIHPLFSKTREENVYSLFTAYEYRLGNEWRDWSVVALAGYKNTDANIKFYDKSQFLTSVGMSYHF